VFYERFERLCQRESVSPTAVARGVNIGKSNVTYWKKGSEPKPETLKKLARYFSVTVNNLLKGITVGDRITEARISAGLTPDQLAEKLDVSAGLVMEWERDLRSPSAEQLTAIGEALGVTWYTDLIPDKVSEADREYEEVLDVLADAGLCVKSAGYGVGPGADGDQYFVWHEDAEDIDEDRTILRYIDLQRVVSAAQESAELRRREYLRKRLDLDLFGI